jgi:ankyrin repeat protein
MSLKVPSRFQIALLSSTFNFSSYYEHESRDLIISHFLLRFQLLCHSERHSALMSIREALLRRIQDVGLNGTKADAEGLLTEFGRHGMDVSSQDQRGQTLLHYTVQNEPVDLAKVKFLHDNVEIDVNIRDNNGETPILQAEAGALELLL